MDKIPKYNVCHRLQKRSLLIAVNCLAGLSIFFFGYDQGKSLSIFTLDLADNHRDDGRRQQC
jgi:hypothetical protein